MPHTKHTNEFSDARNKFVPLKIERKQNLKNDILSGLTVSLALVPEANKKRILLISYLMHIVVQSHTIY